MSRIQLLSEAVASQVAAGEVVERPASVVKELVENSVDAGATRVEVTVRRGGASMVRVVDDGMGMDRDDALLCLERHATSKIRTGLDLATVATFGFRGEALPSIASVSRFRLATREHGAVAGTEILVNGGKIDAVRDSGEAPGTLVEARSLFYNLPARRKFLRSENTEASHIEHQLHLQAIGNPHVGFTHVRDERLVFQLPPATSLAQRLRDLKGETLFRELLEVPDAEFAGIRVRGYVGKPGVSRSNRSQQIVFVNGRAVDNQTIHHALREGYHTALMRGQYPVTYLLIEVEPSTVDVNVHPAKREVRFREPSLVREAVVAAIRRTLESSRGDWEQTFRPAPAMLTQPPQAQSLIAPTTAPALVTPDLLPAEQQFALRKDWWDAKPSIAVPTVPVEIPQALQTPQPPQSPQSPIVVPKESPRPPTPREFRILGILGKLYVLLENADGLVLVDQHAAHERVLFEELRRRLEAQGVPGQRLLIPPTVQLPPRDFDWVRQNLEGLARMGIVLEEFGPATFKIDALPEYLLGEDPTQLVRDMVDELRAASAETSRVRLGEDMIATTVCRHAVKANDVLREPEAAKLIQDLLACELPYCCPHGRPTMIQIGYAELEKKFGRKA